MALGAAVTGRFAIGVGFRKACTAKALAALVGQALAAAAVPREQAVLATITEKDRPVLHAAAAALGLEVVILDKAALAGTDDRISLASERVRACFGIVSVAEAAALAAAGPGAALILRRIATVEATCAIARSDEAPQ